MTLTHRLHLCGCWGPEPVSWPVDGACRPLATARYLREQAALRRLRAEQEQSRIDRRAVVLSAARGHVRAE